MKIKKSNLASAVTIFIVIAALIWILFNTTTLEFNPRAARYRVSSRILGIPFKSTTRDTWITQFGQETSPIWIKVNTISSGSHSLWHNQAAEFSIDLRAIDYYNPYFLSPEAAAEIANRVFERLNASEDMAQGISDAHDWVLCVVEQLPDLSSLDGSIPDDELFAILDDCTANLED